MSIPLASSRRYLYLAVVLLLALTTSGALLWPAPTVAGTIALAADARTLPPGAQVIASLPANRPLRLVVGLALHNASLLDAFLRLRTARSSPLYHGALTPAQFAALFSPTVAEESAVAAYLRGYGLRVTRTYRDRLLLDVAGTAGDIEAAFGTTLVSYRDRHGGVYYANATVPRLPSALARFVTTIVGLRDDTSLHHTPLPRTMPSLVGRASPLSRQSGGTGARSMHPLMALPRRHGPMPRATFLPPATLLTPAQMQAAYDITPIYSQVFTTTSGMSETAAITGAGQTVALYELSPYRSDDIAAYDATFGIMAAAPISVAVDGGATDTFGGKGTAETALDIELIQAVAPGTRILVYNGPASLSTNDNTGADDLYARIVNDDSAQVLSTSWGQCEEAQQQDNPPDLMLVHDLLAQAVAEGMTVVAASGDYGAYDCANADGTPDTSRQTVDYPASDPLVLAVGGTTLAINTDGSVASEGGWAGSGGGYSSYFARPAWQTGPGLTPAPSAKRALPDVALDATNYAVWVSGGWQPINGTSAGPPVWAALLALTNQARYVAAEAAGAPTPASCAVLPGMGDIHPEIYQLGARPGPTPALRDITMGASNGAAVPGPGWDAVTGWGVPDAYTLLRALIAMPLLAAPPPDPCPAVTPTPVPVATQTPVTRAATTPTPSPLQVSTHRHGTGITLRVVPARVRAGGTVLLEMQGTVGRGQQVIFEVRYPGHAVLLVLRMTDARGRASARIRVPASMARHGMLVVRVRVTVRERRQLLAGSALFRVSR